MGKNRKFKEMRRYIREETNAAANAPEYRDTNPKVLGYAGTPGADAENAAEVKLVTTSTLVLNKDCERGLYRAIKKELGKSKSIMKKQL